MGLLGGINAQQRQIISAAHAFLANAQLDAFAGRRDRVHARNRRRVIDETAHAGIEAHHLPQPIKHDFFQLSRSRRSAPEHRLHIKGSAQQLTKNSRR